MTEQTLRCPKNCPDRAVGCHSACERYKAYREYIEKRNAFLRKENDAYGYKQDLRTKIQKRLHHDRRTRPKSD